MVPETRDHQIR